MNIKRFIISAVTGSILWTVLLTPYMVFVVKTTFQQYMAYLLMQAIITPIVAPIVFWATEKVQGWFSND